MVFYVFKQRHYVAKLKTLIEYGTVHSIVCNLQIIMRFLEALDKILFPYDFTKLNGRGLHLSPRNHSTYLLIMTLTATLMQTFLMLYGPTIANFTYLTYWGFTATFIYFVICSLENIFQRVYGNRHGFKTWKIPHFLFPDIICLELMINGVYWLVFFPFIAKNSVLGWLDIVQAIGAHFFPLLLLTIELFNNLVCFWNYLRMATILLIMIGYLILNVVYTINVDIIYPLLTYDDWLTYIFLLGSIVGTVVCYVLLRVFSKFYKEPRMFQIFKSYNDTLQYTGNPTEPNNDNDTPAPIAMMRIELPVAKVTEGREEATTLRVNTDPVGAGSAEEGKHYFVMAMGNKVANDSKDLNVTV